MTPTLEVPIDGGNQMPDTQLMSDVNSQLMSQLMISNQHSAVAMQQVTTSMAEGHAMMMESMRQQYQIKVNEVGLVEGKTAAGVLATDVGGPTNAGK